MNFSNFNNHTACIVSKITDGSNVGYGLEAAGSGNANKLSFWVGDGTDFVEVRSGALSANTWYHVVATNDGTNSKIYLNGALVATAAQGSPTGPTASLGIGIQPTLSESTRWFPGMIDEVAIWNDALTAAEISTLYNSGSALSPSLNSGNYTSSGNLKGYWDFDESSGAQKADADCSQAFGFAFNGLEKYQRAVRGYGMKEKFKIVLPWLVKLYFIYSIILDTFVVGGIVWLILN